MQFYLAKMTSIICLAVIFLFTVSFSAWGHHCTDCPNNLYPELQSLSDPTSVGHCEFGGFYCDDSTPGTGHRVYSSSGLDQLVQLERCYSFCFWNVTPSVGETLESGSAPLFEENVFAGDVCSNQDLMEAFVCYSSCVHHVTGLDVVDRALGGSTNVTCTALCSEGNICQRALPVNASEACRERCENEVCMQSCSSVMSVFINSTGPTLSRVNVAAASLRLGWAQEIPLRKMGVLAVAGSAMGLDSLGAYGLIWNLTNKQGDWLIPQHLPLFLLQSEVGPLYRKGSNLLAIQSLQCQNFNVSYALVDRNGISDFKSMDPSAQCFYGSWYPSPPSSLTIQLAYSRTTGELDLSIDIGAGSGDESEVTSYGLHFLWGNQQGNPECEEFAEVKEYGEGTILKTELVDKTEKRLAVSGKDSVLGYIPTALDMNTVCHYYLLLFSLPQNDSMLYKAGNIYSAYFRSPDFPQLKYNLTEAHTVDSLTGLTRTVVTLTVDEQRWRSLAPLSAFRISLGQLGDQSVGVGGKSKSQILTVHTSQLKYDFVFNDVEPLVNSKQYYQIFQTHLSKQGYPQVPTDGTLQHLRIRLLPSQPGPVRNLTFSHYLDLQGGIFVANASWYGPASPHGSVREYVYTLSSPSASVVIESMLPAEKQSFQSNISVLVTVQIQVEFKNHEYFNFSVRAISEWGALGEWTNTTVAPDFPVNQPTSSFGLPVHIEGVVIGAAILMVILIVAFIVLASTGGYYYYRKNKVVIVKNTGIWINGRHNSTGEEGDEDGDVDFHPVPVDHWEISPDTIIMDCMLGEGQFGEVYKGMIQDGCHQAYTSPSKYVAVKILRPEASAALKSDFLKEIATLKKITMGGCQNVVNMVGCSTMQEPIALVIEYIAHGDLLTYLRTIRKLNNSSYCNMPVLEGGARAKANEYVNHGTTPPTPVTPLTPASTCPLLIDRDIFETSPDTEPAAYERPYSALGDLTAVDLVSFAYQITTGMEYLANLGIVHRDLACRNILVGENKVLKVSDFGMARNEDVYIKTTDGKLPLRWMAVESIVDRIFTTQSDVWSFGIVLWEVTTLGGHPYPAVGNKALLSQLLRGYRMEKPENCSPEIYDVMKNCWNIRSVDRPTFIELRATFDSMLTKAQKENYIDLNVDEMLPYYSMSAVGEDEGVVELTADGLETELKDRKEDYPEMKALSNANLVCSVEQLNEEEDDGDDKRSIGSVEAGAVEVQGPPSDSVRGERDEKC